MSKLKEELLNLIKIANGIKAGQITHKLAEIEDIIKKEKDLYAKEKLKEGVSEDTSDGYHTFKELYEFRKLYNAALFNEWARHNLYDVHKSQRHNDGELCFGRDDYFIVVATLPTGQISNHYPMSDWDLFQCSAVEKAKEAWDGHTANDVADRLKSFLNNANNK